MRKKFLRGNRIAGWALAGVLGISVPSILRLILAKGPAAEAPRSEATPTPLENTLSQFDCETFSLKDLVGLPVPFTDSGATVGESFLLAYQKPDASHQGAAYTVTPVSVCGSPALVLSREARGKERATPGEVIVDVMEEPVASDASLSNLYCKVRGKSDPSLFALVEDSDGDGHRAHRAWRIDETRERFREIPADGITCARDEDGI